MKQLIKSALIVTASSLILAGCAEPPTKGGGDPYAKVEPGYVAPSAPGAVEEEVTSAPPAPRPENVTIQADTKLVWVAGQWRWETGQWVWRAGKWDKPKGPGVIWADDYLPTGGGWVTPPKDNKVWVHAHYLLRDGKHYWVHGVWQ